PGVSVPLTHSVGPSMPPMQVSLAASQLRPSVAQLNWLPHSSRAMPHSQPSSAPLVAAVQGGIGGGSHSNGVTTLQYSPAGQPPLSAVQSIRFTAGSSPQPS